MESNDTPREMPEGNVRHSRRSSYSQSEWLQRRDFLGAIARFWQKTYASDYVTLAGIVTALVLLETFVTPFHRLFNLDNLYIQYPHAEVERVSPFWLLIYAFVIPLCALAAWAVIARPGVHVTHVAFLGFLLGVFATGLVTDVIKNAVGRPRPDLLARCKPRADTPEHTLVSIDVCTETNHHRLHDGWRSFPSGHSSFAFSGLGYVALMICAQFHCLRPTTPLPLACFPVIPLVGALLIAISRTEDYRHDVWDITAGSTLGMLIAYLSYRRYFRSLSHPRCEKPHVRDGGYGVARSPGRPKDEEMTLTPADASDDDEDGEVEGGRVPVLEHPQPRIRG